jgi:ABC-type Zn uptake system ZnuABC Zn-binding protein ZnuA
MATSLRLALALLASTCAGAAGAAPLRVVATLPDLGALAAEVGGSEVSVATLGQGPQDPHFIEPRPSFVRVLHDAELFVQNGLELESAWAQVLLAGARNPDILPGGARHVDASVAIRPLEVPTGPLDRSQGDVHPFGNPHYLSDPLNALRVAQLLAERLAALRPEAGAGFTERRDAFAQRVMEGFLGPALAARHRPAELAEWTESGRLDAELADRGEGDLVSGWLGLARAHAGTRAVEDHRIWSYFARRFGIEVVATLEPKPGLAPTQRHLSEVVGLAQSRDVRLVLQTAYFDPSHARWVAERTGARVVTLAHQTGALPEAKDYVSTLDLNVRRVFGGS